jgi:hypothetical protein
MFLVTLLFTHFVFLKFCVKVILSFKMAKIWTHTRCPCSAYEKWGYKLNDMKCYNKIVLKVAWVAYVKCSRRLGRQF